MSEKKIMLTFDGLKKLETELQVLKTERRKEVAEKIKDARGQGDLSENAEYDSAKEEQAEIEARIAVLEKMLRNAEVIDEEELSEGYVNVGNRVVVLDREFNEQVEYSIVGSAEADPLKGKISNESPLGAALLGRVAGDVVTVDAPDGSIEYEIVSIS
ncbi:MAG: transcription elongation factor GreA [Defluviitaleaceae bacterium]|nr:transcription elongation factor GreA [Defluviitaleaceae bacterium]